ncbi:hypothetical protein LTS15_005691 [Exophiala xenobiotica]|nr:hypothetical protein LTS15_005691 [Exophiala xenobiotica]
MGSLFSDRDAGGARYGKSSKAWSNYMKGASGRFAEYACRGNRQAVILTRPPPNIYSTRQRSNYQQLEEPILKGLFGGPGAATFQYQIWPLDRSSAWYVFLKTLLPRGLASRDLTDISGDCEVVVGRDPIREVVVQTRQDALPHKKMTTVQERERETEVAQQEIKKRKQANRKRAELEQRLAQERKKANKNKAELERHLALAKKDAKWKQVELERQKAWEQKSAKRKKRATIDASALL